MPGEQLRQVRSVFILYQRNMYLAALRDCFLFFFTQVMETVPQVPLQPSIMSQSSPAAYMLVPIHHIPNNPPVVQQVGNRTAVHEAKQFALEERS